MAKSLLEVLRDVSLDPTEQAAYSADPSAYLAQYGYEDVPPDDISEAFSLVADTLPPDVAQTVTESQVANQLGGEATEGLATNGEPTFGAGYDAGVPDPGADLADPGDGFGEDPAFNGDTHFGEGVGDADDADPGFGHGGDGQPEAASLDDGGYDHAGSVDTTDDNYDGRFDTGASPLGQEADVEYDGLGSEGDFDTGAPDDGFDDDVDADFGADDIGSF